MSICRSVQKDGNGLLPSKSAAEARYHGSVARRYREYLYHVILRCLLATAVEIVFNSNIYLLQHYSSHILTYKIAHFSQRTIFTSRAELRPSGLFMLESCGIAATENRAPRCPLALTLKLSPAPAVAVPVCFRADPDVGIGHDRDQPCAGQDE
jgi:hypothetical protein